MKKRTKTTDAVLRDIFDPLNRADENTQHPLSDLSAQERTSPPVNRLEALTKEPRQEPLEVRGQFEDRIEEIQQESLLFRADPAETEAAGSETAEISETPAVSDMPAAEPVPAVIPAEVKVPAPRDHQIVKASVFLVFAGLSAMLGYILYTQNQGIEHKKTVVKTQAAAAAKPASQTSYWLDGIPRQGVSFKMFYAKNQKLMINGAVSDQSALVKFINAMNRSPRYKNAKITSMTAASGALGKKNYEFQVYADIR